MVNVPLSQADKDAVAAAIGEIERRSSAEIVVVAARASSDYGDAAALTAGIAALAGGALAATLWPALPAWMLIAGQTALFALLLALHLAIGLGHRLAPQPLRAARAKRAAAVEFAKLVGGLTSDKRGLLIYLSAAERHIEIVADRGIAAVVPDAEWQRVVAQFTEDARPKGVGPALLAALGACGTLLATACPAEPNQRNELSDRVLED